jgi:hypothetical protein
MAPVEVDPMAEALASAAEPAGNRPALKAVNGN